MDCETQRAGIRRCTKLSVPHIALQKQILHTHPGLKQSLTLIRLNTSGQWLIKKLGREAQRKNESEHGKDKNRNGINPDYPCSLALWGVSNADTPTF